MNTFLGNTIKNALLHNTPSIFFRRGESLVMIITYLIYCVVLHFNTELEKWAHTLPVPFKPAAPCEQSGLVTYKTLDDEGKPPNYGIHPDYSINPDQMWENGEQST